tara:strand:- start:39 stop:443 length:405 start_codon:yes stop_codon:yes gene_type:complete
MSKKTDVILVEKLLKVFVDINGRRPRILLSSTETIKNQNELHKVAIQFSDLGFDVDFAPSFVDTNHLVKQAIENDVHSIHFVVSAEEKMNPIEDIEEALMNNDSSNILVTAIETKELNDSFKAEAIVLLKALQK